EKTGRLSAIVFDKTGTLTEGNLAVVAHETVAGKAGEFELSRLAASLAKPSLHPISRAVATLHTEPLPVTDWEEVRGSGVQAKLNSSKSMGVTFRLGALHWLRECSVDVAAGAAFAAKWTQQGATVLGLAADERLVGMIALRDTLKADA